MVSYAPGDCLLTAFRDVAVQLDALYSRFARLCGLSEAEYWALLMVSEGIMTQSEISTRLFMSKQTLNSAFKSLLHKELVRLEPMESNQRTKQILLTPKGRVFVAQNIVRMYGLEEEAWRLLSEEERGTLTVLTRKFSDQIASALEE